MCVLSAVEPPVAPFPLYVTVYIPFQFAVSAASASPIVNVTASVVEVDDRLPLVFVHPLNTWFVLVGIPIVFVSPLHNENVCVAVAPSHVPPFGFTVSVYILAQFAVKLASASPIVNSTESVVDSDDRLPFVFVHPLNTYPSLVGTAIDFLSPLHNENVCSVVAPSHVPPSGFTVSVYILTQFAVKVASSVPIVNVTSSVVDSDDSVLPSPVFVHPVNLYPSLVGTGIACVPLLSSSVYSLFSPSPFHIPSFGYTVNLWLVVVGSPTLVKTALRLVLTPHSTFAFPVKSSFPLSPSV